LSSLCEVCGVKDSRFVCSSCGRRVCEDCVDLDAWICARCSRQARRKEELEATPIGVRVASLPHILLLIGLVTVALGTAILFVAVVLAGGGISAGGVVFVGPIPIIFGSGGDPALIALVSLLAVAAMLAVVYFLYLRRP